jgi:alpha-D-ribose 1-methylphosphonate 5-triphosphate synthase subunit PhnG
VGDPRLSATTTLELVDARRRWMSVLALATTAELEACWAALGEPPRYVWLRRPEAGLVMVRGRAGGNGARFNLGEMTVTRCTVRLDDGTLGHAWVGGRDTRHAELAAALDALLQDGARAAALLATVVEPLALAQAARRVAARERAAASRVDFFTMVRGED